MGNTALITPPQTSTLPNATQLAALMASRWAQAPAVEATDTEEEVVLLNVTTGLFFGLETVGADLWRYLITGRPVEQVIESMMQEYEVSREVLQEDIVNLLRQLRSRQLIVPLDPQKAA